MTDLNLVDEIKINPLDYATQWKNKHSGLIVGYLCSYVPEEIIWAFGILPFRLFGTKNSFSMADSHLQAYCCSLVRGSFEDALSGRLDFLDGVVFPHTCDSIQRLSDLWRMNIKNQFHADIVLPVKMDSQSSFTYLVELLKKFISEIEGVTGVRLSKDRLAESALLYNEIRSNMNSICMLRQSNPSILKGSFFHDMVNAMFWMDRTDFSRIAAEVATTIKDQVQPSSFRGKRIVLSGGMCNVPDIYSVIEQAGGGIVGEDFCTGERFFDGYIETKGDIIENIARRYLDRINCPAKHKGLFSRGDHLIELVRKVRADGVIFMFLKFCDPHSFDYPYLKKMLDHEGIPSLLVEMEDQYLSEAQFKTRCEAFIEML